MVCIIVKQVLASDDEEFGQQLLEQMTEKERKQLLKYVILLI